MVGRIGNAEDLEDLNTTEHMEARNQQLTLLDPYDQEVNEVIIHPIFGKSM